MQTSVFFYLAYTLKHMSWHKYLLGFHVSLLPAFSALLFVSVANTQEYRFLLSLSTFKSCSSFHSHKREQADPIVLFWVKEKNDLSKAILTGFREI